MNSVRASLLLALASTAAPGAYAVNYTFDPPGTTMIGEWSVQSNWFPTGRPAAGDSITIPSGHTCLVSSDDQAVRNVTIGGGAAALVVRNKTLTIGAAGQVSTVTLNGPIRLEDTLGSGAKSILKFHNNTTITGPYEIMGLATDPLRNEITWATAPSDVVYLSGGRISNWLTLTVNMHLSENAVIQAYDEAEMLIGPGSAGKIVFSSNGISTVRAEDEAQITFQRADLNGHQGPIYANYDSTITWNHYADEPNLANNCPAKYVAAYEGSHLDIRLNLSADKLTCSRSRITVAPGRIALFSAP